MKLALIGYGNMGKMIEKMALSRGHEIVSIIDPSEFGNSISNETVNAAEVCLEFTNPKNVLGNLSRLVSLRKNVVVGTTGWDEHLPKVKSMVDQAPIGLFYSSNFSLGMNLFIKILQDAAKKIIPTGYYDVAGIEEHHKNKLDAPSGTAKTIANALSEALQGTIEIPFTSVRCGSIPGTHTILFDSACDTLTFTHTARSKEGFAVGALAAAEWLKGKTGIYTMDDLLLMPNKGETACIF